MIDSPIASESGHWYYGDGRPCYTVPYADPRKGMRKTSLADARKIDLVPSVTTIARVIAAPGLEIWKDEQILLAAWERCKNGSLGPTGEYAEWSKLVLDESKELSIKARDRGHALHTAIEQVIQTGQADDPQWTPHCISVVDTIKQYGIDLLDMKAKAEHSFARDGYGGKIDFHDDELLLDFKTKDRIDDKVKPYDEHLMQCAAYAHGVGLKRAGNVFIGVEDKQVRVFLYEPEQLAEYFGMFTCLLSYWQRKNRFGIYAKARA